MAEIKEIRLPVSTLIAPLNMRSRKTNSDLDKTELSGKMQTCLTSIVKIGVEEKAGMAGEDPLYERQVIDADSAS